MSLGTVKRIRRAWGVAGILAVTPACSGGSGSAGPSTGQHAGPGPVSSAASRAAQPAPPFPAPENKRPGTSAWRITDLGAADAIEGYADQLNDNTAWQAYNAWGGYSLYQRPDGLPSDRGYAVSFNRPYDGDGAVRFLAFDEAAIALAEHTGVPLAYETDVDLDQDAGLLADARAVISLGHDEYYSQAMRSALLTAREAGTNRAFLGANAIYRPIRFADGDRVIICYKVASLDPLFGQDNAETTQQWRDPPYPRPESVITGVFYECNPVSVPWFLYDPSSWIFAGTGAYRGESFPGMVGPEYDRLNPAVPFPRPLQVLAHSPLTCYGFSTFSDSVYYTVPGGAGVFASGTMRWVCAMRGPSCGHGLSRAAERFVDRATQNLLRAFATGPAGRAHPARDNLALVKPLRIPGPYNGVD